MTDISSEVQLLLWVMGVAFVPVLTWSIAVLWMVRDIKRGTDKLIAMHENADAEGFGTKELLELQRDFAQCLHELVHYVKWGIEKQTKMKPPPPPPISPKGDHI